MQNEHLQWLKQWYQKSPDFVLVFTAGWEPIWQNRSCPMLPPDTDFCRALGFEQTYLPERGTYTLCHAGELYSFRLDITDTQTEPLLLIRISEKPCMHIGWDNATWRREAENQSAALRSQVFGISNATASLYHLFEETSDQFPQLLEEQLTQLNIIKGNCCRLMRTAILWVEQAKYHEMDSIISRPLFLDRELSNFVECSRNILGRTVRIHLDTAKQLCIETNRQRLTQALLCMLLRLCRSRSDTNLLHIYAEQQADCIVLTAKASSNGVDETPHRHAEFQPMFQTSLLSQEEAILKLFCQTYHVMMLYSTTENHTVCTLRFPICDNPPLILESVQSPFQDEAYSVYQIMLADISEYRFY